MPTLDRRLLIAFVATAMLASGAVLAAPSKSAAERAYGSVDPFIGTGGEGHTYPGATVPFGMVQLSPDTDTSCVLRDCYPHAAGYRYDDPTIVGFSHTHFSGAGHSDLGDVLVMPVAGDDVPMIYYSDDEPDQDFERLDGDVRVTSASLSWPSRLSARR